MIVELTLENFKSFSEAATVRFAAGTTSRLSGNLLRQKNGERFVKSMALFGPNASGKTTVVDGLYVLKGFVLSSGGEQKPTSRIWGIDPFLLEESSSKRPSRIAAVIDLEGDRYTFDVSATTERVWKETLTVQHTAKQPSRKTATKVLIERTWDPGQARYSTALDVTLGSELTRISAKEQTTPNRLLIGKLASMNSAIARRILEWFDEDLEFYDMHRNPESEAAALAQTARLLKEDAAFAEVMTRFMKDADTGIQALHVADEITREPVYSELDKKWEWKEGTRPELLFEHAAAGGTKAISFHRQRESSGTLRFVALLAAILRPGPRRRLVCIDELSASMHPDLVRRLLRVVHSGSYNRSGNQVLFTTHDTHLIDPSELLRRDQITICGKDRAGRSATLRLDEFQDAARSDANLQRQYLQGRFGGVPQFGPTLEDVPVDDEPLEVGP